MEVKEAPTEALIGGAWRRLARRFPVVSPATGERVAEVADCGEEEAREALEEAVLAFPAWSRATAYERAQVLRRWYERILEHKEPLARLMALEMGKPLKEEGRGGLRRGVRGVVRRGGEAGLRGDGPLPVSPQADPGALRARGAGLRHHPLELPRGHGDPQGGPGLGGGVHLRAEARGGEPPHRPLPGQALPGGGGPLGSSRSSPPPGPPRSPAPSWRTKGSASSPSRGAPRWG